MNGLGKAISQVRCNRCRKALTVEASRIKGIGPICEKHGLKALGTLASQVVGTDKEVEVLNALEKIKVALFADYEGALDYYDLHREKISQIALDGADHIDLLGVTYEILADVCNQLPGDYAIADSMKMFFFIVGASEEGEAAHKRLCRIVKRSGSGVF